MGQGQKNDLLQSEIDLLNQQLESVVAELHRSLVNGERNQAPLVQPYFEQVRKSMQDVARFYDKRSRLPAERTYLSQVLAIVAPGVNQAENALWTGGDGSMTGTNVISIVPYQDIGPLDIWMRHWGKDPRWTLCIHPANSKRFLQSLTSPERHTAKRAYPAVDVKTTEGALYLEFSNASDAQDAYAFFLYHKQRGT